MFLLPLSRPALPCPATVRLSTAAGQCVELHTLREVAYVVSNTGSRLGAVRP